MDGIPDNQASQPNVEYVRESFFQTPPGKIIFLGIILILAALLLLNYFRIITLPQQFNFLPKKQAQTTDIPKDKILDPIPLLSKTIPPILKSSLLPKVWSKITIKQDQVVKDNFIASWDSEIGKVSAIMTASSNKQEIASLSLSFLNDKNSSASAELAAKVAADFFSISPKGGWGCKSIYDIVYCENFWEENAVKRGISIQSPISLEKTGISIGFCEHHQNTDLYSWKSCTSEFAKTGVK